MNFAAHYDRLIARGRGRFLTGYRERHHVVPRCMGGTDAPDNIVELTAEEHYVAHQLLARIHPTIPGLALAAVRMAKQCTGRRAYAWLRRRVAAFAAVRMRGNAYTLGRPLSSAHRQKLSEALRGRKQPPRTRAHVEKIAEKNRGRALSAAHRAKLSAAHIGRAPSNKGKKHSAETRARMSIAHIGNPSNTGRELSAEHRANVSASLLGNTRRRGKPTKQETKKNLSDALRGRKFSEQRRANISAALRGHRLTDETKAKISAARRAYIANRCISG